MRLRTDKLVLSALLVALGIGLQIAESMIFLPINLPGGKLGLANVVTIILLYTMSAKVAFVCAVIRAFLGSMLYGGLSAALYSVSGAIFSAIVMIVLKHFTKNEFTPIGISVAGAFSHNIAQVCVASMILSNVWIFTYLPILGIASCITGIFTGYAAKYTSGHLIKMNVCK